MIQRPDDQRPENSDQRPDLRLRPIDSILDRFERRRSNRVAQFPPDFLHGDATLAEIYETYGEEWVERTAFVQFHCDDRGRVTAASVATFQDWFLTVEHRAADEEGSLKGWVQERLEDRRTVLELRTAPNDGAGIEGGRWIDLNCSATRLRELERDVLHVVRDGVDEWSMVAQTNLLSLIALSARLGLNRLH